MSWKRAGVGLGCVLHLACTPWTVRPIEDDEVSSRQFDPVAYVDGIWARVMPEAIASAVDAASAIAAHPADQARRSVLVTGTGVVREVDLTSRVGLASVDLEPADGQPDAAIQIGPVLRGTALRDALEFIRFSDFVNQIDFADVASELNARVSRLVLAGIAPSDLEERAIAFYGAVTLGDASGRTPQIVPLTLQIVEQEEIGP